MPISIAASGAEVIPFPSRPRPPVKAGPDGNDTAEALDRALQGLNRALCEQLEAVRAWKQANEALADGLRSLAKDFRALDDSFAALATEKT